MISMSKKFNLMVVDDNKDIHNVFEMYVDNWNDSLSGGSDDELFDLFEDFGEEKKEDANKRGTGNSIPDVELVLSSAYQGEEAIKKVDEKKGKGESVDLIFMDVRMPPGINGIETVEKIWQKNLDIPVVICTAYSDMSWDEIVKKLKHEDKLQYVEKPFNYEMIVQAVKKVLK